ncbi:MAG: hypothetical protein KAR20_26720, partial [Candidatus Heimdallarchaeota archaeon]|nr:hypothetical protein [Candidatus Heimdallarchaeota archaeon]
MNTKIISVIFVVGLMASSGFGTAFSGFGLDDNNPYSFGQEEANQISSEEYVPNEIIVKFTAGTSGEIISAMN